MGGYSLMTGFSPVYVQAGFGIQQQYVDVVKHIIHKSVMESSLWISLFPLQPAHTYACPATSQSEKSYRRLPGSKKQIKYYQCMISRTTELCFLHISPCKPHNNDKTSDFKFQGRWLYQLLGHGLCSAGTPHSYTDSKLSPAEQLSHLFPSEVLL